MGLRKSYSWQFKVSTFLTIEINKTWKFQSVLKTILIYIEDQFSSVSQSIPTLQPHGMQHAKPPSPSPTPRVYPNSCPLKWWCHQIISSSAIPPLLIFPSIRVFSNESVLHIRWPEDWSFQLQHQSFQLIFRTDLL